MTSIFKTPYGELQQFIQNLHSAGFSREDVGHVNDDPLKAVRMYEVMQSTAPSWYVSPEQQLARVWELNERRHWGFVLSEFPYLPENITLREGEVLLLCVYLLALGQKSGLHRTIDELWDVIEVPTDYTKFRRDEAKADATCIRQVPGYGYDPGIRWVVFNPNTYQGKSPEEALELARQDNVQLTGVEGLMANVLFPLWVTSWDSRVSHRPWLSGLQFNRYYDNVAKEANWSLSPNIFRQDNEHVVSFNARSASFADPRWTSPSFREY